MHMARLLSARTYFCMRAAWGSQRSSRAFVPSTSAIVKHPQVLGWLDGDVIVAAKARMMRGRCRRTERAIPNGSVDPFGTDDIHIGKGLGLITSKDDGKIRRESESRRLSCQSWRRSLTCPRLAERH